MCDITMNVLIWQKSQNSDQCLIRKFHQADTDLLHLFFSPSQQGGRVVNFLAIRRQFLQTVLWQTTYCPECPQVGVLTQNLFPKKCFLTQLLGKMSENCFLTRQGELFQSFPYLVTRSLVYTKLKCSVFSPPLSYTLYFFVKLAFHLPERLFLHRSQSQEHIHILGSYQTKFC